MDGVVEIITGRERRRRWSTEDKLRFVAEMAEPGTRVRAVTARHGVCESLLFTWRRQVRDGVLTAPEMPVFMPARMFGTALGTPGLGTPGLDHGDDPRQNLTLCPSRRVSPGAQIL